MLHALTERLEEVVMPDVFHTLHGHYQDDSKENIWLSICL